MTLLIHTVADPGFLRGGGANSQGGREKLLFGQFFPEKCMKIKEIGPRGTGRPWRPLDPPMTYAGTHTHTHTHTHTDI